MGGRGLDSSGSDMDQCLALVKTVINFDFRKNSGTILSG
jgi:hypothetical protein